MLHDVQKTVLITGGSDGIGKALCFKFGLEGYAVSFSGRNKEKLLNVEKSLEKEGILCKSHCLDVAIDSENQELVTSTLATFGRIDVLICNAGLSMRALFQDLKMEVFEKIIQVNFLGTVSLVHHALPHLQQSKGTIIGISSVNGRRATPARTAYAASKYALEGFLESLRMELMNDQIHVLVACPGFTQTNIRSSAIMPDVTEQQETKLNEAKMMSSEVVAAKVYRAMQRRKRDLVLTTQGKWAVRVNKFFPSLMDKIVFRVMAKKPDSPFFKR